MSTRKRETDLEDPLLPWLVVVRTAALTLAGDLHTPSAPHLHHQPALVVVVLVDLVLLLTGDGGGPDPPGLLGDERRPDPVPGRR